MLWSFYAGEALEAREEQAAEMKLKLESLTEEERDAQLQVTFQGLN